MSVDNLNEYQNASDGDKLLMLRSELRRHLATINGYSAVLKAQLSKENITLQDDKILEWVDKIVEAGKNMDEIIEILTSST